MATRVGQLVYRFILAVQELTRRVRNAEDAHVDIFADGDTMDSEIELAALGLGSAVNELEDRLQVVEAKAAAAQAAMDSLCERVDGQGAMLGALLGGLQDLRLATLG